MLAEMDDRVRAELLPEPEVEREVAVRRDEVRAVVGLGRVDVVAARRLDADHDAAEGQQAEREGAVAHVRVVGRGTPARLDGRPHGFRQGREPGRVALQW